MNEHEAQELSERIRLVGGSIGVLSMELDDKMKDMSIGQLVRLIEWCQELKKLVAVVERDATMTASGLVPRDTKALEWSAGDDKYRTELHWRSVRTKVDKDGLVKKVRSTCRYVDESTGELHEDLPAMLDRLSKVFRFEPRWTEIKALGIDPDEFCETKYEPQIQTTQVTSDN